jgi:hypothetical protein
MARNATQESWGRLERKCYALRDWDKKFCASALLGVSLAESRKTFPASSVIRSHHWSLFVNWILRHAGIRPADVFVPVWSPLKPRPTWTRGGSGGFQGGSPPGLRHGRRPRVTIRNGR